VTQPRIHGLYIVASPVRDLSLLKRIDAYVIRWARRKFKRMRHRTKGARDWFDRFRRTNPHLFAHWFLCHGNGRKSGAV